MVSFLMWSDMQYQLDICRVPLTVIHITTMSFTLQKQEWFHSREIYLLVNYSKFINSLGKDLAEIVSGLIKTKKVEPFPVISSCRVILT